MSGPRRHHYVAQHYLRRFAHHRGLLTTVDLVKGMNRKDLPVASVAAMANYYDLAGPESKQGTDQKIVENTFSALEGRAETALKMVVDHEVWPLPPELRGYLAEYVAVQALGTPTARRLHQLIADEMGWQADVRHEHIMGLIDMASDLTTT